MKARMLFDDCNSSAVMVAACRRGSVCTLPLRVPVFSVGKGLRGTTLGIGGGRCHSLAKGSKVDRVVEGVSSGDRTGARRRAAGIRVEGTYEPTNGFKVIEVGGAG